MLSNHLPLKSTIRVVRPIDIAKSRPGGTIFGIQDIYSDGTPVDKLGRNQMAHHLAQ